MTTPNLLSLFPWKFFGNRTGKISRDRSFFMSMGGGGWWDLGGGGGTRKKMALKGGATKKIE